MTYIDEIYKEYETSNIVVWVETDEKSMKYYNHNYICLDLENYGSLDDLINAINYELFYRFKIKLAENDIKQVKEIYNVFNGREVGIFGTRLY